LVGYNFLNLFWWDDPSLTPVKGALLLLGFGIGVKIDVPYLRIGHRRTVFPASVEREQIYPQFLLSINLNFYASSTVDCFFENLVTHFKVFCSGFYIAFHVFTNIMVTRQLDDVARSIKAVAWFWHRSQNQRSLSIGHRLTYRLYTSAARGGINEHFGLLSISVYW